MADVMTLSGMQPVISASAAAPTATATSTATTTLQEMDRTVAGVTMGVVAALFIIPLSIVLVRLYIRCSVARRFRADDCFITIAMTLAIANVVALVFHCRESMVSNVLMMKATWVFYMTSWPTVWAIKMNVLCQCSYIFAKLGSMHARYLIWGVMAFVTASMLAAGGSTLFACHPIAKLWIPGASIASCVDVAAMRFANTAISTLEDFIVLMLAALVVLRTELNLRNKVYLFGILKLGGIAFVASIVRLVSEALAFTQGANHHPRLWALLPIAAALQVDLGIAAASLPSFAPLLPANRQSKPSERRTLDVEAISSRPGSRFGRKSFMDEKLEMVNKSILVEREYSIKSELSPIHSRVHSRRNSFSKAFDNNDLGADSKAIFSVSNAKKLDGSDKSLDAIVTIQQVEGNSRAQHVISPEEDDAEKEIQNRVRAARLLGLSEEENKYLSAVLPQRWSIWGARENRKSQQG